MASPPTVAARPAVSDSRATRRVSPGTGVRVALVLVGLLLPLLLAEAALRVAGALLPGDYQTTSFLEAHPEFGRRNKPGAGWKKTSEFTSWIEVNSKGLRGAEVDYAKPPGEVRVLVLGDSFTFAEQVNQHETFTQRLEDRLNADGGGRSYRVLNAGSNGWATANELVFLAKEGVRYQPDVVVLAMYLGNDVSDNYRRMDIKRVAEDADLALRGADAFEGPRRLLRRSMLYTYFESGVLAKLPWFASAEGGDSDASNRKSPRTLEEAQEAWAITEGLVDRLRDVAESQGARFMVMVVPSADLVASGGRVEEPDADDLEDGITGEAKPGFEDPHGTFGQIAARHGLATLDLYATFREASARSKQRLYYRQNAHWTAAGHAIAADELHAFLTAQRLLPR